MGLSPGTQLGAHQIIGLLGAGGMGEVYRARDTRLNRDVAIKVLPPQYASDPERVSRFQREAQAVAALNHPAVGSIYEFAQVDGIGFLVLELIEGETLADRLRRESVPPEEALAIAKEVCEALEAAHEKGICHRDLKPANIKLTPDGKVKVLDFGLAKVLQDNSVTPNVTNSPTLSLAGTLPGVILGTAAYMSPEQAKGHAADQRSDIFSLGCILYELLTGRQAFEGDTASEILASVLKSEPDYARLPPTLEPRVVDLMRRCLAKLPKQRWHAVADVRAEIEAVLARGVFTKESRVEARTVWGRALLVAAGVILGALMAAFGLLALRPSTAPPIARFAMSLPEGQAFSATNRAVIAVSPDGSTLAYIANNQLYVRPIDDLEPRPITGTERANPSYVAFSPDGRSLAYAAASDQALKRIGVSGGASITICKVEIGALFGLSWTADGILFAQAGRGVFRVSPNGGTPELLIQSGADETLGAPRFLPGGRAILYSVAKGNSAGRWDSGQIAVQSIGGARKVLIEGGSDAHYVSTGHIVYALGGSLLAMPFDLGRLEVSGGQVAVLEGVRRAAYVINSPATAQYAIADAGALVYIPGPVNVSASDTDLALIDRQGHARPLNLPRAPYRSPRTSANGRTVAVGTDTGKEAIIWVYDLNAGSVIRRLTFGGNNRYPAWSADSQWVTFQSDREGDLAIFRQRADGTTGQPERLTRAEPGVEHVPYAWSPDGKILLVGVSKSGRFALWALKWPERAFAQWGGVEDSIPIQPVISPDGRWIAYQSSETGSPQIIVQPFPMGGAKYMLPVDLQPHHPAWSPDGRAITYIPRLGVNYIVDFTTRPQVALGTPRVIERGARLEGPAAAHRNHDPVPGGEQIVGVIPAGAAATARLSQQINVVLNWFQDLKQRAPKP